MFIDLLNSHSMNFLIHKALEKLDIFLLTNFFFQGTLLYVLQGEDIDSDDNGNFEFFGSAVPDNMTIDKTTGLIKAKTKLESTSSSRLVTVTTSRKSSVKFRLRE